MLVLVDKNTQIMVLLRPTDWHPPQGSDAYRKSAARRETCRF